MGNEIKQLVNRALNCDKKALEVLLLKFDPLIIKYAKKLCDVEFDDARQELILILIENIHNLGKCNNENEYISYIHKIIYHKFCKLYKQAKKEKDNLHDVSDDFFLCLHSEECYAVLLTRISASQVMHNLSRSTRTIIEYVLDGYSDCDIANMLDISRQYVNREKNKVRQKYLSNTQHEDL